MDTQNKTVQQVELTTREYKRCPVWYEFRWCNGDCTKCKDYYSWVRAIAEEMEEERKQHI